MISLCILRKGNPNGGHRSCPRQQKTMRKHPKVPVDTAMVKHMDNRMDKGCTAGRDTFVIHHSHMSLGMYV